MKMIKRLAVMALVLLVGSSPAFAQAYPDKLIKMVVPFPAGSTIDALARFVAEELHKALGQTVIVENQAGADGIIAAQAVKRAPADGYTIMMSTSSPHAANPALYASLPYDPAKDFEPVATVMSVPQVLVIRKEYAANDVATFVRVAKQPPAKTINFATGNTASHVLGELFKSATKLDMTAIPYKGMPQALQDLAGGQVDLTFTDRNLAAPLIEKGLIKALAITDTTRLPSLPNVPTMAEAGYKSVELSAWAGVFVPAKTDPAIVERLNREINKIIASPQGREYIGKLGAKPISMSPAEFRVFLASEIARWGKLVEMAGIAKK